MTIIYLLSLFSGLFYGITESINKNITEKKFSVFSYAFLQFFLNLLIYSVFFLFWGSFPKELGAFLYLFASAFLIIFGNILLIKSYKTEDLSNVNIISRSSLVVAFLVGVFLLNEKVNLFKISGISLIIVGILVIFYEGKKIRLSPGFLFTLVSGLFYGLSTYFYKKSLLYFSIISEIFFFYVFCVVMMLLIPRALEDVKSIFGKYRKKIIISRIGLVLGNFLFTWCMQNGAVSVVNTNTETFFLLTTVFIGIFFLGEKKSLWHKILGSLFCILGIILINFF